VQAAETNGGGNDVEARQVFDFRMIGEFEIIVP